MGINDGTIRSARTTSINTDGNGVYFVERLEDRSLLAGDVFDFGIPPEPVPPAEYRSPNVSDKLAEVAYEFDQWAASNPTREFVPSDPVIHINDGRVGVEAVTTGSAQQLSIELQGIGADIIAVGSTGVAVSVPLTRIRDLSDLSDLTFAGPPLGVAQTGSTPGGAETGEVAVGEISSTPDNAAPGQVVDLGVAPDHSMADVPASFKSPRASDMLSQAAHDFTRVAGTAAEAGFAPRNDLMHVRNGYALVEAVTLGSVATLAYALQSLGANVVATGSTGVSAWIPLPKIPALDGVNQPTFAGPSLSSAITSIGNTTTQGDTVLKSDSVRTALAAKKSSEPERWADAEKLNHESVVWLI